MQDKHKKAIRIAAGLALIAYASKAYWLKQPDTDKKPAPVAAAVIRGARRAAIAVTSGRTAALVGGSSNSAPRTELARPGMTVRTVPNATSTLSVAAPCTVAAVKPDCSRRM